MLDQAIIEFDKALRTVFAPARSVRPVPGEDIPDAELSDAERAHAAALMRVNHVGEVCAQALYQGQSIMSRDPAIRDTLRQASQEETEHLAWTERRIAELQARYRLLPHRGPDRYACAGDARNELLVSWFDTQPPTLYAERGDSVSLMFREPQPPAPGEVLYVGRNESLRVRPSGQLGLRWGVDATEITCVKQP